MDYYQWHKMTPSEQWEYVYRMDHIYEKVRTRESMLGDGNYVPTEQYRKIKKERDDAVDELSFVSASKNAFIRERDQVIDGLLKTNARMFDLGTQRLKEIDELRKALDLSMKSDAESIAMYRRARDRADDYNRELEEARTTIERMNAVRMRDQEEIVEQFNVVKEQRDHARKELTNTAVIAQERYIEIERLKNELKHIASMPFLSDQPYSVYDAAKCANDALIKNREGTKTGK